MFNTIQRRRFRFDVLRVPLLGGFLKWKHSRTAMQSVLFGLAAIMIVDGLLGSPLAPRNVATVAAWVHYRGLVVLALLLAGNLFCAACPFVLPRKLAKWLGRPTRRWPKALRNKWLALAGLVGILFAYELFDLWATPWWTAWVAVGYFAAAFVLEALFTRSSFCLYVCPLGTFNFLYSTLSPLQIQARDMQTCRDCTTHECINGATASSTTAASPAQAGMNFSGKNQYGTVTQQPIALEDPGFRWPDDKAVVRQPFTQPRITQQGCQLELFVPTMQSNLDCTLCLDCVKACPYDNVALAARPPGDELFRQTWPHRLDLALLAVVAAFLGLANALAMTPPGVAAEIWLADRLGTQNEAIVLGILFVAGALILPLALIYGAAEINRRTGQSETRSRLLMRYAYSFVPLGFAVWLAHYLFHFLIGPLTIVPALQIFFAETLGLPLLGEPNWAIARALIVPGPLLQAIQLGITYVGLLVALAVALAASRRAASSRRDALIATLPWGVILVGLATLGAWTWLQPMMMRGNVLGG